MSSYHIHCNFSNLHVTMLFTELLDTFLFIWHFVGKNIFQVGVIRKRPNNGRNATLGKKTLRKTFNIKSISMTSFLNTDE